MSTDDKPPSKRASWLDRLVNHLSPTPENRAELEAVLQKSHESSIIDDDALRIMEGALHVGEQHAGDIMIPRSHMRYIRVDAGIEEVLELISDSGHSRFPVVGKSVEDVQGILLAKDLIPLIATGGEADIRALLRPATIISESKRLSVLLREFREQRYHMAIVIDEYGSIAGLVTIEDILEEIVGEIEDETDEEEIASIEKLSKNLYRVEAQAEIHEFNEHFDSDLSEDDYDTLSGLITSLFGHLPAVGEAVEIGNFRFEVAEADSRRILRFHVTQNPAPS